MEFTKENKTLIKGHFERFALSVKEWGDINNPNSVSVIADEYIEDQIRMYEAMNQHYELLRQIEKENIELLKSVKKEKGRTFYKYLMEILEDTEGISKEGLARIVDKPRGTFQEEKHGRQIDGIWVEQWVTNLEGDSYSGLVWVKLSEGRYLEIPFSM
jgi:hypothetical protein